MRHHLTGALATVLLAVGLVLGVPTVLPVGSADAAPGRCEPGSGVTVVVDFGALGGGVPIGCDPSGGGKPASQVIPAAGFSPSYVNGQPFVCRIDGKPSAEQEGCQRTPPADAYWGLFWSDGTSGTWTYSSQGVAGLEVPAGGSIGLRWQDGGDREQPGAAPTPAPKGEPTPSPSPTKKPAASTAPQPGGGSSPAGGETAPTAAPTSATDRPTSAIAAEEQEKVDKRPRRTRTPRADASPAEAVTVSADPTPSVDLADGGTAEGELADATEVAATDGGDGGSSGLTWVAVLLVLALAGGVAVTALRRRA